MQLALYAVLLLTQNAANRVNTRLVQISVVVLDKSGPVGGLTKENFNLTDNGKPQRIDVFRAADSRNATSRGTMPANVVSNYIDDIGAVPQNTTAILFDMMNSAAEPAVKQLVSYLRTFREGDRVGLFVLGYELHAIQDWTGDPNVMRRAAERLKELDEAKIEVSTQAQLGSLLAPPPITNADKSVTYAGAPGFSNAVSVSSAVNRAAATADAFVAIARHLSGLSGRKNVVWLSGGFPLVNDTANDVSSPLYRATKALTDADVSIYPVDCPGTGGTLPETMKRLASATGVRVTYRPNDLREAVAAAVADSQVSYTVGFYPVDFKYDGKLHDLKVSVDRKDVELRYRPGYYASPKNLSEKERKEILNELLDSDVNSSEIGLIVAREPDPAMPGTWMITISVDAANLEIIQKGDRRVGQVGLAMRVESSKSKTPQVGVTPLTFTEEQYQNILKRGFVIRQTVQAGRSDDRLRIVVQDQSTGLAGALWLPLSI